METTLRMPVAVDLVILTVMDGELRVLLVRRGIKPFKDQWALPGGFVRRGESLEAAARRELQEETGIVPTRVGHIEQLATFGDPRRDPREQIISVAYLALVPDLPEPKAGGDAEEARVVAIGDTDRDGLAFDHTVILRTGVERARAKLEYSSLATAFCGDRFTIHALRKIYEAVWGTALDPANFHRKVTKTAGFVVATRELAQGESGRPAKLYRKGGAQALHPPLLRTNTATVR
jgi:8-oxo-dGTP diphosphatase